MALILVEMISGRPLVDEPTSFANLAKLHPGPPAPSECFDASPLRRVLERALAPLGARFPNAGSFADALRDVMDDEERRFLAATRIDP
jgi:hypothetical protein